MLQLLYSVVRIHLPHLRLHTLTHLHQAHQGDHLEEAAELPWVRI